MAYRLFLFDADDTLFDFRAAEVLAFHATMRFFKIEADVEAVFATYRHESASLWRQLEQGLVTIDLLKKERFLRTFASHGIEVCPEAAGRQYLERLPDEVPLIAHAREICEFLSGHGEVGIITNGVGSVQRRRLEKSGLAPWISFMAVSESCGYAKPDVRFFEYASRLARGFDKAATVMIGDRLETDIAGAHAFGIDACFFNPSGQAMTLARAPRYEIKRLEELRRLA